MDSFFNYCKNFILENIDEYEGSDVYLCDLGLKMTEGMNADGSFSYSRKEGEKYLVEWIGEAKEFSDYEVFAFGERSNPFENVELFLVRMVIEGVRSILAKCPTIDQNWNDCIELTAEVIQNIKDEVEAISESEDLF